MTAEALEIKGSVPVPTNPLDLPPEEFKAILDRREENRKVLLEWIWSALVKGVDYGPIHFVKRSVCSRGKDCDIPNHWSKNSLFKPGSEKICDRLGVTPTWPMLEQYEQRALEGDTIEQIVLRCELVNRNGEVMGVGVGARAVSYDSGDLNKAFKMCKKSGAIDATLTLWGLSEIFTQDIEDMDKGQFTEQLPQPAREDLIGFGVHAGESWMSVTDTYLKTLAAKTRNPDYKRFALAELKARELEVVEEKHGLQEIKTDLSENELKALCVERYAEEDPDKLDPANRRDLTDYLKAHAEVEKLDSQVNPEVSSAMCQMLFARSYCQLDVGQMREFWKHLSTYLLVLKAKEPLSRSAYDCVVAEWRSKTGVEIEAGTTDQLTFLLAGLRKADSA